MAPSGRLSPVLPAAFPRDGTARPTLQGRPPTPTEPPPVLVFLRYCEAMDKFASAAAIRPVGDDSAVIRWNACVRAIRRRQLQPGLEAEEFEPAWARQRD